MDRGYVLRRLALVLGCIGAGLLVWYGYAVPKSFRVAVGPAESAQHRFAQAMARALKDTQTSYKLEIVPVADSAAASAALDRRKVDLAVIRSDDSTSAEARAVAILQKRQLIIAARKEAGIKSVSDLKGRTVALLNIGAESNRAALETILQHFAFSTKDLVLDEIEAQTVAQYAKRHDAYVLFANPATGLPKALLDAIVQQGSEPVIVSVPGAEGLALRLRELLTGSVPAGAFGGNPPIPTEALSTVAISYELVATSDMSQTDAKEVLSALIEARTRIRRLLPRTSFDIEAPPVDEQRRFLPHIGAAAYVNDDEAETFLETYSEQIWLALFGLSILGSSIAGFLGWTGYFDSKAAGEKAMESRMRELAERVAAAGDLAALDAVRGELDDIVLSHLKEQGKRPTNGNEAGMAVWLASLAEIVERRRAGLKAAAPVAARDRHEAAAPLRRESA